MSSDNILEVTDKEGWKKVFPLEKAIIYVGSDPRNDVPLDPVRGSGVSRRHLQLIAVTGTGYRLINMGETDVRLGVHGETSLPPRAFLELNPGEKVQVGDFVLRFEGDTPLLMGDAGANTLPGSQRSRSIGLSLVLPSTQLELDKPLEGTVVVRNWGRQTGVQFKLDVDGLDPQLLEIGPGPILFPNAEKEVYFRVHHPRAAKPAAGDYRLRIRATAPQAYPGEAAVVTQTIQLMPYYNHKLRLLSM